MLYADQDERRGCVKIITRAALSFIPVLISEVICGCLCLLLGLWSIYVVCQVNHRFNKIRSNNQAVKVAPTATTPQTDHYQPVQILHKLIPEMKVNENQANKVIDNQTVPRRSNVTTPLNKIDKSLHGNTLPS